MKVIKTILISSAILTFSGLVGCEQRGDLQDQPRGRMDETAPAPGQADGRLGNETSPFGQEREIETDPTDDGVGRFERTVPGDGVMQGQERQGGIERPEVTEEGQTDLENSGTQL